MQAFCERYFVQALVDRNHAATLSKSVFIYFLPFSSQTIEKPPGRGNPVVSHVIRLRLALEGFRHPVAYYFRRLISNAGSPGHIYSSSDFSLIGPETSFQVENAAAPD